ncbi:MAG: MATE family efflux transporter [Saprospiraceae bacterium]|jgi:putative MATE family efflux protein|nr:MATE family efflux transporter [Saprospiraceae bacterium]
MRKLYHLLLEALKGEEKSYTTGSITRAIVLLSIPMVLEMAMESLFAVVDAFFVAKISVDAVAVVGLTESVLTLIYSLAIGLSMAATAMIARRIGEEHPEEASKAAFQAILLGVGISVVISIAGLIWAEDILRLLGGSEQLIASGIGYTRIALGSNIVITLLFLNNGILRGAGDAAAAMRVLWLANGINIVLDPILIFGWGPFPEMGVAGAAMATAIGRGIGVLYQFYLLTKAGSRIRILWRHVQVQAEVIKRLINVGATGAGQFIIASASWIFLMTIIARFGSEAVAGYTIAIRLLVFTILPSWGIANAAATLVGQNLGANHPERAETSVWQAARYNMYFLLTVSVVYFFTADWLLSFFTQEEAVVKAGVTSLRIICAGYVFFAYGMVISQAFNGAGDTRTPTIINLICFWMLEIPLGYVLAIPANLGLAGVSMAIAISETTAAVLCIAIFRRGAWKLVKI